MNTHKDMEYKRRGSTSTHLISISYLEQRFRANEYAVFVIGATLRSFYIGGRHKVCPDVQSET
jgi:hypothetical protein